MIVLLLGQDPLAQRLRSFFEQTRRRPRHDTSKVPSVLPVALYLLSDLSWAQEARKRLTQILSRLAQGGGVALLPALTRKTGGRQEGKSLDIV